MPALPPELLGTLTVGAAITLWAWWRWRTAPAHRAPHGLVQFVSVLALAVVSLGVSAVQLVPGAWFAAIGVDPHDGRAVRHLAFPLGTLAALGAGIAARRRWPVGAPPGAAPVRPPSGDLDATHLAPGERVLWDERPLPLLGWSGWALLAGVAVLAVWLPGVADSAFTLGLVVVAVLVLGAWVLLLHLDRTTSAVRVSARGLRVVAWWGRDIREAVPLASLVAAVPVGRGDVVPTTGGAVWGEGGADRRRRWISSAPEAVLLVLTEREVVVVGTRRAAQLAALVNGLVTREAARGDGHAARAGAVPAGAAPSSVG